MSSGYSQRFDCSTRNAARPTPAKLTEHNLDLEFNSLDAQREASEAYIKSQAHERAGAWSRTAMMTAGSPEPPSTALPYKTSWPMSEPIRGQSTPCNASSEKAANKPDVTRASSG